MRKVFAVVIYFAIGVGVVAVYAERRGKEVPDGVAGFASVILWPGFIAAEVYRAVAPVSPKNGGGA